MVSFRKFLVATAALAFGASLAMAQCSFTGTSVLRQEGVAEPLTPITVTCTDATPGALAAVTEVFSNITIYSDVAVTSAPAKAANGSDAEIQLMANGTPYPGTITGANTVTFSNVSLTGVYAAGVPATNTFTFTINGLRLNASLMTASSANAPNAAGFNMFASPLDKTPVVSGLFAGSPFYRLNTVAYAIPTFQFAVNYGADGKGTEISLPQCDAKNANVATPTADSPSFPLIFNINFTELYNGAFLTKDDESTRIPGHVAATQGTRLSATFTGLPAGTQVWINAFPASNGLAATLVKGAKADGSGGSFATTDDATKGSDGNYYVAITVGTPVIFEVTGDTPTTPATLVVQGAVAYTGTPSLAAATSGTVSANYAPQSTNAGSAAGPLPRFNSTPVTASGLYGVTACSTSLLYPYITTQPGWNVGLAVSNTGADPFGNAGQSGTCAFSFYGAAGAPANAVTLGAAGFGDTGSILPGTTAADVASNAIGAGTTFQGYAVAVCNFQYAHGYAFVIGNVGGAEVAHGYLALVLQKADKPLARGKQNGQYEQVGF